MNISYPDQIALLKNRINAMLIARNKQESGVANPSPLWHEMLGVFQYLMELSPESLRNVRFHTGLINGETLAYWHCYPPKDGTREAKGLGYAAMVSGIPDRYRASEPLTPFLPEPLGVMYEGKNINVNITRFQNCMSALYHAGAWDFIENATERQVVVEVGGGYGGLAHCLKGGLGQKASYVIVDLPEMLIFSGAFLLVNNPDKSIWVYDEKEAAGSGLVEKILSHDFVLLPNFVVDRLLELKEIAVFINMQSFQEMTDSQIIQYLEIARQKVTFCLYSDNLDCHPHNKALSSLSKLLSERFDVTPKPEMYTKLYQGLDLRSHFCYMKYIAQPSGAVHKAKPVPQFLLLPVGFIRAGFSRNSLPRRIVRWLRKRIALLQ